MDNSGGLSDAASFHAFLSVVPDAISRDNAEHAHRRPSSTLRGAAGTDLETTSDAAGPPDDLQYLLPPRSFIPQETRSRSQSPIVPRATSPPAQPRHFIPRDATPECRDIRAPPSKKRGVPPEAASRRTKRTKWKTCKLVEVKQEPEETRGMLSFIDEADVPLYHHRPLASSGEKQEPVQDEARRVPPPSLVDAKREPEETSALLWSTAQIDVPFYRHRPPAGSETKPKSEAPLALHPVFRQDETSVGALLAKDRRRSALLTSLAVKSGIAAREDVDRAIEQDAIWMANEFVWALRYCPESILALRGEMANDVLNLLQEFLDASGVFKHFQEDGARMPEADPDAMRRIGRHMLLQLSVQSGILPSSLFIKKVHADTSAHPIGSGAYADVYQGEYEGELVALKRLRVFSNVSGRSEPHKRFCREALPWRQLRHPRILPFLGIDCDSYAPYLCMVSPLMKNGNLMAYLEMRGREDTDLLGLMVDVAEGLEYLHGQYLVHGDLRAANVFVDDDGRACISDFGLVLLLECIDNNSSIGAGNPRWMAPELQASDESRRSPASDIYSLGCLCLELITGKVPFAEINVSARVTLKVANGERPTRPSDAQFPVGVSADEMWSLMERCWSQDSSSRPSACLVYVELQRL